MALYFAGSLYFPLAAGAGGEPEEQVLVLGLIMMGSMAVLFLAVLLGMIFSLLGAVAVPAATAHFAAQDSLKAAFQIGRWWRILKADMLGYFIAWVIIAGLTSVLYTGMTLGYYTLILCWLIPFLTAPITLYTLLVGAALFGQTYREGVALLSTK